MPLYDVRTTCQAKPGDEPTVQTTVNMPFVGTEFGLLHHTLRLYDMQAVFLLKNTRREDGWLVYDADELTRVEVRPSACLP